MHICTCIYIHMHTCITLNILYQIFLNELNLKIIYFSKKKGSVNVHWNWWGSVPPTGLRTSVLYAVRCGKDENAGAATCPGTHSRWWWPSWQSGHWQDCWRCRSTLRHRSVLTGWWPGNRRKWWSWSRRRRLHHLCPTGQWPLSQIPTCILTTRFSPLWQCWELWG